MRGGRGTLAAWVVRATGGTAVLLALSGPLAGQQVNGAVGGSGGGGDWPDDVAVPAAQRPLALPRLGSPVTFDGIPDDDAWQAIRALPVTMLWPTAGGTMTEATEIRVAYDDEALWASGVFRDTSGAGVSSNSLYRDRWNSDDAFDVIVDPFNDDRTALKFTVLPSGVLIDDEIANDADFIAGVEPMNSEWDGFWEAATHVDDDGWSVEVRIPFSTLRFQPDASGDVVMGIIAARFIARNSEKHIFPAITTEWQLPDFKPSQARDVRLTDVGTPRLLEVAPFVVGGRSSERLPAGAPPGTEETTREVGLDIKYGLTTNLTADLTLNMDFAQVESDALQVNLGRFNLFFPEKRGFFQERSSVFSFNMSDEARLFHSRTIGLTPNGQPLRILGGGRVAGRLGSFDVGALSLQVDEGLGVPSENVTAARARRTSRNGSMVGGMFTSRLPSEGDARFDLGLDGTLALGSEQFGTAQLAYTGGRGAAPESTLDRSLLRVFLEKRSGRGWAGNLDVVRAGSGFRPALGFMERTNYLVAKGHVRHTWQRDSASPWSWFRLMSTQRLFLRNDDGSIESALFRIRGNGVFKGGTFINAALNFDYEDLDEPLRLPDDVAVPAGSYLGPNLFVNVWMPHRAGVSGEAIMHVGTFLDGWRTTLELVPTWQPSRHVSTSAELRLNRLWFPVRDETVDAHVLRFRLGVAADTRLSAETFVQYETATERTSVDGRVRFRLSEGRDLFLVLTGSQFPDARFADLPTQEARRTGLMFKYVHTLRP